MSALDDLVPRDVCKDVLHLSERSLDAAIRSGFLQVETPEKQVDCELLDFTTIDLICYIFRKSIIRNGFDNGRFGVGKLIEDELAILVDAVEEIERANQSPIYSEVLLSSAGVSASNFLFSPQILHHAVHNVNEMLVSIERSGNRVFDFRLAVLCCPTGGNISEGEVRAISRRLFNYPRHNLPAIPESAKVLKA